MSPGNTSTRVGGGRHVVDVVARSSSGTNILVSLKWQQVSGTAEQKVPFEVICLWDAVMNSGGRFARAYLVLGGDGWKLREFYTSGGLNTYMMHSEYVNIVNLEAFVARANNGEL